MKKRLIEEIKNVHADFSLTDIERALDYFEERNFSAKEIVLEEGKVCKHLYFAESAIMRCFYFDHNGEERTLWMKPEQTFLTEYKSFTTQMPSTFQLQFYEDTKAYVISREGLLDLYKSSVDWGLFGVKLTEHTHVTLIDVFVNLLSNDATRNYQYIEYMFPRFLQVAPLKDIASMLNVSQVTLSRIRSGTQTKKW